MSFRASSGCARIRLIGPIAGALLIAGAGLVTSASAQAPRHGGAPQMHMPSGAGPQMRHDGPGAAQIQQVPGAAGVPRQARGAFAQSQVSGSVQFHNALQPYGRWQQHSRYGEVWIPGNRRANWRPYTVGRWAYTQDWGWYWVADRAEADWGWITYHYGRWALDPDFGWIWVAGDEWGPGF